ncbi:MAG: prephenate/arogenate dehydrogenase family protein [Pseudomonadota bacterium]
MFDRVALIGLGLIGSSLARAMKRDGLAAEIVGAARSRETRETALSLGFIDRAEALPHEAARDADLVVLCTPVGALGAVMQAIGPELKPGAIVTDVGSVKAAVIEAVLPHMPDHAQFVPGHPIAGTEHSGPEAGFPELFENRWCILTPIADTDPGAVAKVRALWEAVGSNVEEMTPDHHDRVLAITSHLPHLIAYTIVGTASDLEEVTRSEVIKFSAAGFRDFTRLAASDPTMWRDVFLTNKDSTLELLGRFTEDLIALQRAIRWDDGEALHKHFSRTREIRRGIVEIGQDTDAPDFGRRTAEKSD